MTKVVLHGELAQLIGRAEWFFEITSPIEAFRALEANTGKVVRHLMANLNREYRLLVNGKDIKGQEDLVLQRRKLKTIDIIPSVEGAGNSGSWLALIGLIIVAAVLFLPSGGASSGLVAITSSAYTLSFTSSLFLTIGLALTLSGVASMLYGSPQSNQQKDVKNDPSYLFDGPVNSYRQGNPVPVGFGGMRIGSQVVSAGFRSVDIPVSYASAQTSSNS